jgi:predicted RecB family nuclease
MTPELRERLSQINIGRKHSEETKAKMAAARIGRVCSEETRRKISEANKLSHPAKPKEPKIPKQRKPVSEETRLKQRIAKLGRKMSKSQLEKMKAIAAARKGIPRSAETRAKMSEAKRAGWAMKKLAAIQQTFNN